MKSILRETRLLYIMFTSSQRNIQPISKMANRTWTNVVGLVPIKERTDLNEGCSTVQDWSPVY